MIKIAWLRSRSRLCRKREIRCGIRLLKEIMNTQHIQRVNHTLEKMGKSSTSLSES